MTTILTVVMLGVFALQCINDVYLRTPVEILAGIDSDVL